MGRRKWLLRLLEKKLLLLELALSLSECPGVLGLRGLLGLSLLGFLGVLELRELLPGLGLWL